MKKIIVGFLALGMVAFTPLFAGCSADPSEEVGEEGVDQVEQAVGCPVQIKCPTPPAVPNWPYAAADGWNGITCYHYGGGTSFVSSGTCQTCCPYWVSSPPPGGCPGLQWATTWNCF